ncbi:hypothetical protein D7W79_40160, partial [Corallococcus exercitus]|uniref:hypothetical protein n=1 Tax=Corallococcus exercitus TaxID=2316736 RepID=UPI000EA376A2
MSMRVVLAVLLWASVAGAVELSNEFSLESPRYGRLLASVGSARAASGGGVTLLVWSDDRRGDNNAAYGTGPEIFATRIDAEGKVLDPAGIPLCTASHGQEAPSVTWDGQQFLVVWQDFRDNNHYAIYGARVSPDGTVTTPPDGFRISAPIPVVDGEWEEAPRVASSGGVSLVVWQRNTRTAYDHDILGARVRDDGTVLDPTPRVLVSAAGNQESPSVAAGTDGFLVAWSDGRHQVGESLQWDIYATRVAPSGEVLDPAGIPVSVLASSAQTFPRLVFDGTNYLAVWGDSRNSSYGDLYGGRVSPDGKPLDGTGVRITPASNDYKEGRALAFDGTQTWVVWLAATNSFDEGIYGVRLGTDGVVKDTQRVPLFTHAGQKGLQDLVFDGTRLRAVWTEYVGSFGARSGRFETDGRLVDGAGSFLARGANLQDEPSVASSGGTALMAWRDRLGEQTGSSTRVRAQRLDAEGQPTGNVLELPSTTPVGRTAVGAGDSMYLVAWGEDVAGYDIRAQRVRADGTLIDAKPLKLATGTLSGPSSIASSGNDFFVVWEEPGSRITGAMVRADGSVSSPIRLPRPASSLQKQLQPKVAFNGTHFLVVWSNYDGGNYDIHAARVSPTGQLVDVTPQVICAANAAQYEPNVAAHGDFLVTWSDYRTSGAVGEIRATRVANDGTVEDPEGKVVVTGVALRRNSQPMFDGSGFTVLWEEGLEAFMGVKLARVSLDGTAVAAEPVDVWRYQDDARTAGMALLAPHKGVVIYQRFDSGPGLQVDRVHGRVLTLTEDGPPDAGSGDAGTDGGVDAGTGEGGDAGTDGGGGTDAGTD